MTSLKCEIGVEIKMKKIILLLTLSVLLTSCYALEMGNYRNCSYNEEDGLYYDWREYPKKVPCTSLNKKIERDRKKGY